MSMRGYPDWQAPLTLGGRLAYAAFEQPGRFYAVPAALEARGEGDRPPLQLDLYQQDRGHAGLAEFGLLALRYAADFSLPALYEAAAGMAVAPRFEPLPVESGLLRLTSAAALALPDAVSAPRPLDVAGAGSLAGGVRLDAMAAELFVGALRQGLATLGAEAWIVARGVAARGPGRMDVDLAVLAAALGTGPADAGMSDDGLHAVDALLDRLAEAPESLGVRLTPSPAPDERRATAQAVLDRLLDRYAVVAAPPAGRAGSWVRFDRERMATGFATWPLDEPMLAPRCFALRTDPLGPLRQLPLSELEGRVVRRHAVPALATGWQRLVVDTTISLPLLGAATSTLELQAPPHPPLRPTTLRRSLVLEAASLPALVDLRLAPGEALRYEWQAVAFVGSEAVRGPMRTSERQHLVIVPDDFGVDLVRLEADAGWLSEAVTEFTCRGLRPGGPWQVLGRLDEPPGHATIAVPRDVSVATLEARAAARLDGRRCAMAPVPLASMRLDAFSFDGTGLRTVALRLDPAHDGCTVELCPEDGAGDPARHARLRLTPAQPEASWTWLALSPFCTGYRWRLAGETRWSDPRQPGTPLALPGGSHPAEGASMADPPLTIDGVRLSSLPGEPARWSYVPTRPGVAAGADGRPQCALIEAGPAAFLALTTAWGLDSEAGGSLRAKLAAQRGLAPDQVQLSPAPATVHEAVLLLGDGQGAFEPLARSSSSGSPPYHAAFNVTLAATPHAAVKRALAGERGWLAVRYDTTVGSQSGGAHGSSRSATSETTTTTIVRSSDGGVSTTGTTRSESRDDTAGGGTPQAAAESFQSDAADWGLPRP